MSLRIHQIEVASMHLPRWFPAIPIHPAALGTWVAGREALRLLRAVSKLGRRGEPTYVWLIEGADAGPILVDTGIPSAELGSAWYSPSVRWKQAADQRLERILPERTGLRVEDIQVVINTHIHFDHCGQNALFTGRRIMVQRRDLEVAERHMCGRYGTHPFDVGYHPSALEGVEWDVREGDFEVCKGVRVIATPGHTPGSQTVLVDTDEGTVGIAGDLFYSSFSMPEKMLGEEGFRRFGLTPYRCHGRLIYKPHEHALRRIEEKRLYESELFGYYVTPVFDSLEELLSSFARVDRESQIILASHNGVTRDLRVVG